ncbi:hypothetical protein O1611_g3665 [Lasiodiplodia mahajangana]|uniref:Uncharacterized protein n=1 Tax=Lasiodiplodia mahajangana TaxID=1108764 RepID=A0ACC2JR41_9PEZI|nr:hypothetical protein O1611_g3665 [Lasiodiplodia mahajangana]
MSSTVSDSDSDSDSYTRTGDIPPTIFTSDSDSDVGITAQPAIMTWRTPDGKDQCLSRLNLDLHYDRNNNGAFFKLRAAVALKSSPRSSTTAVWLFIHPERIRALVLNTSPRTKEARILGPGTVCLNFELSRLPVLVVPKEPLTARNPASGSLLDSLRAAVQQANFSVYAQIPRRNLSLQKLVALCSAASRNELKSTIAHSDTISVYGGSGGDTIEGDSLLCPGSTADSEGYGSAIEPLVGKPPSYSEVPPGPPPAAVVPGPYKRRRLSSPGPQPTLAHLDRKYIEQICSHMLGNKLEQLTHDVNKNLRDLEKRVTKYIDEQLIFLRNETREYVEQKTEEECSSVRLEIEDYREPLITLGYMKREELVSRSPSNVTYGGILNIYGGTR